MLTLASTILHTASNDAAGKQNSQPLIAIRGWLFQFLKRLSSDLFDVDVHMRHSHSRIILSTTLLNRWAFVRFNMRSSPDERSRMRRTTILLRRPDPHRHHLHLRRPMRQSGPHRPPEWNLPVPLSNQKDFL